MSTHTDTVANDLNNDVDFNTTNAEGNNMTQENEVTANVAPIKKASEVTEVLMNDGTIANFVGRRKLLKDSTINEDGSFDLSLKFLNGEIRSIHIAPAQFLNYAIHGASQKFGDTFNAEDDLEDGINAIDEMALRLAKGEWIAERAKGEGKGGSMLVAALVEAYSLNRDKVQNFLLNKSIPEKRALMASDELKPIIDRIKAEKAAKAKPKADKPKADTSALLESLQELV